MNVLSMEEATALLKNPTGAPAQYGPVRWCDVSTRCALRGCTSPTFVKVDGVPYCMKHAIDQLNALVLKCRGR